MSDDAKAMLTVGIAFYLWVGFMVRLAYRRYSTERGLPLYRSDWVMVPTWFFLTFLAILGTTARFWVEEELRGAARQTPK